MRSSRTTSRWRWCSPARTCRSSTARATPLPRGCAAAATCSPIRREGDPELILIATGSDVALAVDAYEALSGDGVRARVVSLPSFHLFDQQPAEYRESVLPASVTARVSIEEASTLGWDRYVGPAGEMIGMHTFGSSAPLQATCSAKFGFTPERVVETAREVLSRRR